MTCQKYHKCPGIIIIICQGTYSTFIQMCQLTPNCLRSLVDGLVFFLQKEFGMGNGNAARGRGKILLTKKKNFKASP